MRELKRHSNISANGRNDEYHTEYRHILPNFCQIAPHIARSCQYFGNLVESFQILPNFVEFSQILPNPAKSCQIWAHLVTSWQILPNQVDPCQILEIYPAIVDLSKSRPIFVVLSCQTWLNLAKYCQILPYIANPC